VATNFAESLSIIRDYFSRIPIKAACSLLLQRVMPFVHRESLGRKSSKKRLVIAFFLPEMKPVNYFGRERHSAVDMSHFVNAGDTVGSRFSVSCIFFVCQDENFGSLPEEESTCDTNK
jgi:hypothetical protein